MEDISDCQDTVSGHVQYTAPYHNSGGGPGGWGSAIIEVPYEYYRHYGEKEVLEKYYGQMRRYIQYLESRCENNLVVKSLPGHWCLGDWCGPDIVDTVPFTCCCQQVILPAAFVNTYFLVKDLKRLIYIAKVINKGNDICEYEEKIEKYISAIKGAYRDSYDDNFLMNLQGANAFALDIGAGDERTFENLIKYYQYLKHYDTGIFGTDIVTRVLFERGEGDLALDLLTCDHEISFEAWRKRGATSLWEYWQTYQDRSHSHHMFGAVVSYFFEYLLGISQTDDSAGYESVEIKPFITEKLGSVSGKITTPNGEIKVSYKKAGGKIKFEITIPKNTKAVFRYNEIDRSLKVGENVFEEIL